VLLGEILPPHSLRNGVTLGDARQFLVAKGFDESRG
jgi:hypothetical protein